MSNIAIKVENISKKYIIRHEKKSAHYETFSDTLIQGSKNIANKIIHPFSGREIDTQTKEEFWALQEINFEINQGDKVGIIGRNGAGKSTLLKILSRITEPTTGKIHINGRIASLLEVGTGFHPELTGRENVFLNGAFLGMTRKEIKAKFDEIVYFAEVEKFLDTPVKRYSSGMYVRLAFSVAAHLEPEILVVDEVLAVGDAEFQKKCLGKMKDVGKDGRTILFVSHNMTAIQSLCNKALFLSEGVLKKNGSIDTVLNAYMFNSYSKKDDLYSLQRCGSFGTKIRFSACTLFNSKMEKSDNYKFGEIFFVELKCLGIELIKNLQFVVGINDKFEHRISTILSYGGEQAIKVNINQFKRAVLKVRLCLNPGLYTITISLRNEIEGFDQIQNVCSFTIDKARDVNILNDAYVPYGLVHLVNPEWEIS